MTTTHDLIEICKKLRYDLTAAQAKVTDVMQALDGANIKPEGIDPVEQIRRQISNGAIADRVDLDAELTAHPNLAEGERVALITLLEAKTAV